MTYSITPDQHKATRDKYDLPYDRLVRESERYKITSIARSTAWQLEKEGKYPLRKSLGANSWNWKASTIRSISSMLRPIGKSLMVS